MKELGPYLPLVAGCFGALLGSFLNVVIYRLPRESLTVGRPLRSFCPQCGRSLSWYENIPIVSYLIQGGRCRGCRTGIPLRYPVVESLTVLLFVAVTFKDMDGFLMEGPDRLQLFCIYIVRLVLVMVAIVVTFIDIDFRIIPNEINYAGAAAAPILSALLPLLHGNDYVYGLLIGSLPPWTASLIASLAGAATGAGSLLLVAAAGRWIFKKDAMGLGDVKFMALMGGFLGGAGCLLVFLMACLLGAFIGIGYKLLTGKHEIPFGPFLSMGMVILILFRAEVIEFILDTWPRWINGMLS
jgi:leader peptidase (prepilin peptidase)/N-methyltransferase